MGDDLLITHRMSVSGQIPELAGLRFEGRGREMDPKICQAFGYTSEPGEMPARTDEQVGEHFVDERARAAEPYLCTVFMRCFMFWWLILYCEALDADS